MSFSLDARIPLGFQGYDPQVGQRNALMRLQMQAAERDLDEQNALRAVLERAGGGLSAEDPAKRAAAASELASVGPRGYQIAAPILTGVRNERQVASIFGGGGAPAVAPAGAAGPAPSGPDNPQWGDRSLPRGLRNNNPLNLTFVAGQPGVQGSDGRFGRYNTPEEGIAAATRQIQMYGQRGLRTVSQIVGTWAPPNENNTGAYVANVARAIGVDPNAPLDLSDPALVSRLVGAMGQIEVGRPLPADVVQRGVALGLGGGGNAIPASAGGAPSAAPGAPARPSTPGQPTPAQFAQLVQAAASNNEVAQRLVQAWAPFMRQENAAEPLERIRFPDGSERLVPRREAAGMVSAPPPAAGSEGERMRARYIELDGRRGGLNPREAQELALIERQMTMPQTLVDATGSIRVVQPPPLPRGAENAPTVPLSALGGQAAPAAASDAGPAVVPSGQRAQATTQVPGGATVTTIPGQRPPQALDGTTRRDLVDLGGRLSTLGRLAQSFNDRYGGYAVSGVGQAVAAAGRVFGDTSGMSQWWQDYQEFKNIIRNQLFGAALTATEKAEFDRAAINPGMAPSQIRQNLGRQLEIAQGVARRQAQTLVNDNFNPESVASALGVPLEQIGAARDPAMQAGPGGQGVATPPPRAPRPGDVQDGYRFRGGDPSRRESWEQVR